MKKHTLIGFFMLLSLCFLSCIDEPPPPPPPGFGTIYGFVYDLRGGAHVRDANVQLRPTGQTTTTGSDGRFQFSNIKAGTYSIKVTCFGYSDLVDPHNIIVRADESVQRNVMIEREPITPTLVASDGTTNDIMGLTFNSAEDSRSFSIFNKNPYPLEWSITSPGWIIFNPASGIVNAGGGLHPIVVTIDPDKQPEDISMATITIVFSPQAGSRDLFISTQTAVSLTLNANPTNGGTVNPAAAQLVVPGVQVPISATANSEHDFVHWMVTSGQAQIAGETNASTTVVLHADATISAIFRRKNGDTPTNVSLAAQLRELHLNAESGGDYTIRLSNNENIGAQPLSFTDRSNITVRIIGIGGERTVQLTDNGSLFAIGTGVTLVVGNNVTLRGHDRNNSPLISVGNRGVLIIESGAKILGNTDTRWSGGISGIYVGMDGHFFMRSGEISGMGGSSGGVYVADGGYFEMSGGRIMNNRASTVGGVGINGMFKMIGGIISGNTTTNNSGGGVHMWGGIFEMEGGSIFNNTADGSNRGGGVHVSNAIFNMTGGEIYGNSANIGGGVHVANNARIHKTGGIIYGHVRLDDRRNTARAGITSNTSGHAVFVDSTPNKRRETTAEEELILDSRVTGVAGGWE